MWEKLIEETGARITKIHEDILDRILDNIQNGKRMQILAGPNASGKTLMACLLLLKLNRTTYPEQGQRSYLKQTYLFPEPTLPRSWRKPGG